jgi:hypothetical protein
MSGSPWEKLLVKDYFWIVILLLAGIFLGIAIDEVHHHGWREIWEIVKPAFTWAFFIYFLLIIGAVVLALLGSAYLNSEMPQDTFFWKCINALTRAPGGFFALFTGVATLLALVLTTHSLMEFKRTITSFTELIYRLCDMLDNASSDDPFRMVCYTPALGCLALSDKVYEMFRHRLCKMEDEGMEPRAEIICLGPEELEEWHSRFKGRWTLRKLNGRVKGHVVDDLLLDEAKKDSKRIVEELTPADVQEPHVKYLPHQFMPGFYFFFTNKRAIIVAPFFLQNPKGVPMWSGRNALSVEMIGFETTDMGIIGTLQKMYERYKSFPSKLVAETSELVLIQEIEEINREIAKCDWSGANPSMNKLKRMLQQLGGEFQQSVQGDYRQFLTQSQKAELNLRLLYVDSEQ